MIKFLEIKNQLKNNGDYVDVSTNENEIYIHYGDYTFTKRKKYFLDYNGKFIQSNYSLQPIIKRLNKLLKEVQ
mgnify:CR=1